MLVVVIEARWSARTKAVEINKYLEEVLQVLQDMRFNENETSDAMQRDNPMLIYNFLTLLGLWNKVLIHIDGIQKRLQDPGMNFHYAASRFESPPRSL